MGNGTLGFSFLTETRNESVFFVNNIMSRRSTRFLTPEKMESAGMEELSATEGSAEEEDRNTKKKYKINYVHLVRRFMKKITADRTSVYSAQACFYLIMSFAPMLFLLLTFLKYTPLTEEMVMETISYLANDEIMVYIQSLVNAIYHGSFRFFSFAALSLFWVTGTGIMGLTNGLNSVYGIKENRNYFILRLRSSCYAVLLVFALLLSLGVLVTELRISTFLRSRIPLMTRHPYIGPMLMFLAVLVMLTLIFAALYMFLPNRKATFKSQIYGAAFTTFSWGVFSLIFSIYLTLAKNLSILYGGLLTFIMVLFWLYFCLWLFFFGAELNAWIENQDSFPF